MVNIWFMDFQSHGGAPTGWFISWKIASIIGWWLGVPYFRKPPYVPTIRPHVLRSALDSGGDIFCTGKKELLENGKSMKWKSNKENGVKVNGVKVNGVKVKYFTMRKLSDFLEELKLVRGRRCPKKKRSQPITINTTSPQRYLFFLSWINR